MSPTSTRPSQSCCPTTPFSLSDGVDHGHAESVAPPPPPRTPWAMATPSRPAQDDGGFPARRRIPRASLSVSVSSLIANGREHEMMKIAKSGMSFGQGANKRIILLLVLWLAFAYGIFIAGCGSD
uniref:Uncharacterized protein n=1 Tax=Oryza barthii TaxID=65489 RepID=A0A0D3F2D0_9ORYZ